MLKRIIALALMLFVTSCFLIACTTQGQQGIQGEKGERGESGAQGEKGERGENGAQGEKGERGENGAQGEKGDNGRGIVKTEIKDGCLWITYSDDLDNPVNIGKITAEEENENPYGFEFYLLPDGTYGVTAGEALYLDKIVIPEAYKGKAVTQILPSAFSGAYNLTEIVLPDTLKSIGNSAFFNCGNLIKINIPSGVEVISNQAFAYCSSLEEITLSDNLNFIGEKAFRDCSKLTSIVIGEKVSYIGEYAFFNCALNSVEFKKADGWKAGEASISADSLKKAETAAKYLTDTYCNSEWTSN